MYKILHGSIPILCTEWMEFSRLNGGIFGFFSHGKSFSGRSATVADFATACARPPSNDQQLAHTVPPTVRVQVLSPGAMQSISTKKTSQKGTSPKRTSKQKGASKTISTQKKPTAEERKAQCVTDISVTAQ